MNISRNIRHSRLAQIVFLLLVAVLVSELLSKAVVYFVLGIKGGDYAHYYASDPKLNLITWTEGYTPHPYFGYESSTLRASEKILSEVGGDDFVIGILGGSVAGGFAEYAIRNPSRFESLRQAVDKKNLRIVNLSNGGFKQPQQFFVAAYFMDKLDLVINVDGLNDAQPSHLLPVYPLEFPNFPQFYGRTSHGGVYVTIGRSARGAYKIINHAPSSRWMPGLSRSSLYFVCWSIASDLLYRMVKASEAAYYMNEFVAHQSETLRNTSQKQFMEKRIGIWERYTSLENNLVGKVAGKPVFFFLQPNQYLKNSKPLSEQEKQIAIDPTSMESNHEMMMLLKAAVEDLRRSGVPITDLTGIFSDTHEMIYKDACCHVNDQGNQMMADAVVSHIMSSRKAFR